MYKQQPKSPMLKALKGNQGKLPQQLKEKILASPAKQTTANEFAYEKSLKDKEMGKSTKAVDKVKAAYDAMTTDKTMLTLRRAIVKPLKKLTTLSLLLR